MISSFSDYVFTSASFSISIQKKKKKKAKTKKKKKKKEKRKKYFSQTEMKSYYIVKEWSRVTQYIYYNN